MELTKRYRKDPSMVARKIAEEFILVPIRQNVGDLQSIYTLNSVGARIWELIDGNTSLSAILEAILQEYEVDEAEAEQDLAEFLNELESIGAVVGSVE